MFQKDWPHLRLDINYRITSGQTSLSNFLAWSVGIENRYLWPDAGEQYGWPADIPREETIEAITTFLVKLGFDPCADGSLEYGYEKLVIYADRIGPTHVARQLPDGKWASKLGDLVDIHH